MYLFIDEAGDINQGDEFTEEDKFAVREGVLTIVNLNPHYLMYAFYDPETNDFELVASR